MKNIEFDLINKKKDLGKRRVSRFTSSVKKVVSEIIHGEFAVICSDFSVLDAHMSIDLRYANILISFFTEDKKKQEEILEKLNSNDRKKTYLIGANTLKSFISSKISQKMRLKNMPDIRFKIISDDYYYLNI